MDTLTQATILASGAVLLIQQILKLNIIPVAFANRYPVPTNIILSVLATVITTVTTVHIDWSVHNAPVLLRTFGLIAVGSAIAYNQLLSKWVQLKESEGEGKA
jgi:hypothetical protein